MIFDQTPEFSKELKKFIKKWRNLPANLEILPQVIDTLYVGANGLSPEHIRETFFATKKGAVLKTIDNSTEVVKVRLDSTDLNKDMLRVVFIRRGQQIKLIGLYPKNDKAREDNPRIQKYLTTD